MADTSFSISAQVVGPLDRKVAVVTGASSGIGRAIALQLGRAGANVVVHAGHRRQAAEEVAAQLRDWGRQATVVIADLRQAEQRAELVDQAWRWAGCVDIWVNNAGADVLTGEAARWPFAARLQLLWEVDVVATIELSRAAGQRMRHEAHQAGQKLILNIGWDQADVGMEGDSGQMFAATKGAIMCFSRSLAQSLAPEVRVNCLAPGWIRTAWGERASEYWQERACRESLLGRWGTPDDVAQVACFLASPAGAFINGQIIRINGGLRRGWRPTAPGAAPSSGEVT
ncbi:MAG: 3-oxoacyl-ACP reductase [Pirellulaceae bacterium]|nr:MAG: 3-oxoacyl-ACP reductase [Pirellulaceae bacterium]